MIGCPVITLDQLCKALNRATARLWITPLGFSMFRWTPWGFAEFENYGDPS